VLKVHTKDGLTSRIDLEDEEQAKEWFARLKEPDFQEGITGLTIAYRGVNYSLPRPVGFRNLFFLAEHVCPDPSKKIKGGERIVATLDDIRVAVMVHRAQKAVRIGLTKAGKQRFNPFLR
jgi:hypothetical protein